MITEINSNIKQTTTFKNDFSKQIYEQTYRFGEETINDTIYRIANDLASIEEDRKKWTDNFVELLNNFKFVPGGRIISNAGVPLRGTSMINCFVDGFMGNDQDSMEGILDTLRRQALILKSEGGYGFCADVMRPRGSFIKGIGNESPGSVKMLEMWDTQSSVITEGSGNKSTRKDSKGKIRKGAQMVTLSCWHPDIEEFITAKQTPGKLTKFNMSVLITDDFMRCVKNNLPWSLEFPDYETQSDTYKKEWNGDIKTWKEKGHKTSVFKTYENANDLWNIIMESTYCVDGRTKIPVYIDNTYYQKTLSDIHNDVSAGVNVYCLSINKNTLEVEKKKITNSYSNGKKDILRIETSHNIYNVTPEHVLFKGEGGHMVEVKAGEIKIGDNLLSSEINRLDVDNKIGDEIDTDFWQFLGLWVGDGSIRKNHIRFTVNSDQISDISPLLKRISNRYNRDIHITTDKRSDNYVEISIYSVELYNTIISLGLGVREGKYVPEILYNSNIENIKAFISGYLSADGYVSKDDKDFKIVYYSKYEKLADGIKNLLMILGIKSHKKEIYHKKYNTSGFRVQINSYYSSILKSKINFLVSSKNINVNKEYNKIYPIRIDDYFKLPRNKNKKHLYDFNKFTSIKNLSDETKLLLNNKNIIYDKAQKITKLDAVNVYDITVEDNENFIDIFGGLYHNCRNEPGVLFIDTINDLNNLKYCEFINATNPCISGDTLIATADGRNAVSIRQLAHEKKDVPVYSTNSEGKIEIKWGRNPRLTGNKKEVWKLKLDDNSELIATPDHKIYLKNNTYCELKNLKPGDSISSFYSFESNKYRQIAQVGSKMSGGRFRNRRQYRIIHEFFNDSEIDYKLFSIHHKDFNSKNDCISNLELLPVEEHRRLHSDRIKGLKNPYHRFSDIQKFALASHPGEKNPKYSGISNELLLKKAKELYNREGKFTLDMWIKFAKEENIPYSVYNNFRFGSFSNFKNQVVDNHKVISVEFVGYEDVYNITVDDNHNYNIITSYDDENYINSGGICVKNCGEQVLPIGGVCLLGSINLTQFIDFENQNWNYSELKKFIPSIVRLMDNVNDKTYVPLEYQKENLINKRRIGLGMMGYGSALMMLKIKYGSEKAIKLTDELMSFIANNAYQASALLAKEKGAFSLYNEDEYLKSNFINNSLSKETIELIKKYGIRNSHLLSIQPTGNSSIFANNVSGGLEPLFMSEYIRTSSMPYAPEGLDAPKNIDWENKTYESITNWKWIKEGDENLLSAEFNGYTWKFDKNRGLLRETLIEDYAVQFLKSKGEWDENAEWAATTTSLGIDEHINTMGAIAKYIDSAISKTINLPNEYPYDEFKNLYTKLYETETIKGGTTYRAGTMTSVLSSKDKKDDKTGGNVLTKTEAPRRPKTLNCDIHHVTVQGDKWTVIIGLYGDNKDPYEVFAFKKKSISISNSIKEGKLTKIKKGKYDLDINGIIIENIKEHFTSDEEEALTRMISTALRHGASINFIYEQLQKSEGTIVSFSKAVARTLKKYLNDDSFEALNCPQCGAEHGLVMQEGCYVCRQCGFSRC